MQKHTSAKFLAALCTLLSTLAFAQAASADTINLAWDPNPEPQVIGYIVHVGTQPGSYTQHIDVGPTTTWSFTSAVAGQQYCFAVSAYVAGPLEGPRSNEVCGFSNAPPALVNPGTQNSIVGQPASLQLAGSDPKGDPLTYSATGLPPGLTVMASTGYISGTPTTAGTYSVTAKTSDGVLTASQTFTWTITVLDTTPPVVTITGPTSAATYTTSATTMSLSGTASDAVGVTQVSWVNNRGGSGTATGTTSWSVSAITLQAGSNVLTVTARDAAGNTSSDVLTVTVNAPPTLAAVANQSSVTGLATTLQLVGSDPNGDPLTYSATSLPSGLSVGSSSGLISGTPTVVGTYNVTVSVSDGAQSASRTFTWTVTASTSGPGTLRLTWDAVPDPRVLGYKVYVGTQPGVYTQTFDVGLVTTWTFPSPVAGQQYCFAVSAYIAGNVEGPKSAEVCGYSNQAPTLASVANQSTSVGQAVTLQLAGSDPDGMTLTYSATGLPTGLSMTASTGLITGTPTSAGVFTVTASVSDGVLTTSRSFTWTIVAPGDTTAPVVAITGPTTASTFAASAATLSLTGTASDNVGVTQVSWTNNRGGSGTASGTTSWSATVALQSGANAIAVTARDAAGNIATATLTVTLNVAPTLASVANQSTVHGQSTSLQLSGADADGDPLTYGGNGLPPGLALAVSTGLIAGTPTTPGTYPITVTVSDAAHTASRTFTWTVTAETGAPVVTITNPTTAATFSTSGATLALAGTASDDIAVTQVSWANNRGGNGTATGTANWSASVVLQSGSNILTVTARDAAGNTSTDVLTVTYTPGDTTKPVIAITSPTGEAVLTWTTSTVTLSGTASDNVGVSRVTWINDRGGSGTATGTTNWSASRVVLLPGINVLTVTASDAAGNTSSDVVTVTYNASSIRVDSLTANRTAPQRLGTTVTFTAVAKGGTAPYQYQWLVYHGEWVTKQSWSSNSQFVWTPTTANSVYKVRVMVRSTSAPTTTASATVDFPIVP
jgi:hypothetical protein